MAQIECGDFKKKKKKKKNLAPDQFPFNELLELAQIVLDLLLAWWPLCSGSDSGLSQFQCDNLIGQANPVYLSSSSSVVISQDRQIEFIFVPVLVW